MASSQGTSRPSTQIHLEASMMVSLAETEDGRRRTADGRPILVEFGVDAVRLLFVWRSRESKYLACQSRTASNRSWRWLGLPERLISWPSPGKRSISTGVPARSKARKYCSACSIGQRKSFSEWMIRVGVVT